jgi:hypothetical protein
MTTKSSAKKGKSGPERYTLDEIEAYRRGAKTDLGRPRVAAEIGRGAIALHRVVVGLRTAFKDEGGEHRIKIESVHTTDNGVQLTHDGPRVICEAQLVFATKADSVAFRLELQPERDRLTIVDSGHTFPIDEVESIADALAQMLTSVA